MFVKSLRACLALILLLMMTGISNACVGRILYIGALDTDADKLMGELLVLLINERTGTNVKMRYFENNDQLYAAFKSQDENERIDIVIEDTVDALSVLKLASTKNLDEDFTLVKEKFEKTLDIIWLSPFGYNNSKANQVKSISAPIVRRDVLTNFPLLPRVLNKLSGAISDEVFSELVAKTKGGEKAKNVAKDFLRSKKFI